MKQILTLIIIGFALSTQAADITVKLNAEQEAAVNAVVAAENAVINLYNANTNNAVKMTVVTPAIVLARYAQRLVAIQSTTRQQAVLEKFNKATEEQKTAIEAEAAKVTVAPK